MATSGAGKDRTPTSGFHAGPTYEHNTIAMAGTRKPAEFLYPLNPAACETGCQESSAALSEILDPVPENKESGSVATLSDSALCGRLDMIAQTLQQEMERLSRNSVSSSLGNQIQAIQHLSKELKQEHHPSFDDNNKDGKDPEERDEDMIVCELRKFGMDEWQRHSPIPESGSVYVIEAFYRSLPIFDTIPEHMGREGRPMDRQEQPHRVVIRSDILTYELEDITGVTIRNQAPTIFAPPYKMLIRYYPKIAERLSHLQDQMARMEKQHHSSNNPVAPLQPEKAQSSPIPDAVSPSVPVSSETTSSTNLGTKNSPCNEPAMRGEDDESKRAELDTRIDHLRLLGDFIQRELAPSIDLSQRIKEGNLEKVAFEDLWFLFQPGEVLYFKDHGHDQLGKAYAVTGGQQRKRLPTKEETLAAMPSYRMTSYEMYSFKDDATPMRNSARGTWTPLTVDYYTMVFDGYLVGAVDGRQQIKHYAGERNITDLPIYPLRFHKKRDEMAQKLTARGQKYCSSYGHKSYSGSTSPLDQQDSPEEVQGDIFIDFRDYRRTLPKRDRFDPVRRPRPKLGLLQRTNPDAAEAEEATPGFTWSLCDPEVDEKATEDFLSLQQPDLEPVEFDMFVQSEGNLQLFSHRVPAYVFRTRKYVHVDIGLVSTIDKSDEARENSFRDLVIPNSHRSILIGLVKNQMTAGPEPGPIDNASTQIDIVRGKGRGLIILLHGPPGSGKTSTAETLAAYTQRPLYPITCGDLGTQADQVERSLVEHTERAQQWGCILLLDEADVFLTRRDWRNTNHNALVSVFLRQLEYYSGILILTTNRVGVLDEAFKSRIHVSLAYPTIELEATLNIWGGILQRIDRDNKTATIKIKFDRNALLSFAETHYKDHSRSKTAWNGRQIRNAFQLAIALGHHDRDKKLEAAGLTAEEAADSGDRKWMTVRLTVDNFRHISKTARDFDDYLHATRGYDDSTIAKYMMIRHDESPDEYAEPSLRVAKKDYGQQRRHAASRGFLGGGERTSALLTADRNRQRPQQQQTSSGSGGHRRGRSSRGEEDAVEEKGNADEEDIFEEFSSDDD